MGEHGKVVLVREWSRGHGGEGEQEGEVKRKMAWPSGEVTCYISCFGFLPLVNILEWGEMCAGYTW